MHQDIDKNEDVVYEEENTEDNNLLSKPLQIKLQKLKKQLEDCCEEKEKYLIGWQRAQADLINYRHRQEEQMGEWQKLMNEKIIVDLLPILDTMDRGAETEGIRLAREQFWGVLKSYGLKEIKTLGEKFNPNFHEALAANAGDGEDGKITEEFQKGYVLNNRVIRVAKVKINKI